MHKHTHDIFHINQVASHPHLFQICASSHDGHRTFHILFNVLQLCLTLTSLQSNSIYNITTAVHMC